VGWNPFAPTYPEPDTPADTTLTPNQARQAEEARQTTARLREQVQRRATRNP